MSVVFSPLALHDLREGLDSIAKQNPAAAETIQQHLMRVAVLLDSGVMEGTAASIRSHRTARRFYVHPFWIYYKRIKEKTWVVRVYHHARKPLH